MRTELHDKYLPQVVLGPEYELYFFRIGIKIIAASSSMIWLSAGGIEIIGARHKRVERADIKQTCINSCIALKCDIRGISCF